MSVSAWRVSEQQQLVFIVSPRNLRTVVERCQLVQQLRQRTHHNSNCEHIICCVCLRAGSDMERLGMRELRGQLVQIELRNWRLHFVLVESSDAIDRRDVFVCVRLRGWILPERWLVHW